MAAGQRLPRSTLGGQGQRRDPGDVGAAGRAGAAQDVDDLRAVAVAQRAEGALGPGRCSDAVNLSPDTRICQ